MIKKLQLLGTSLTGGGGRGRGDTEEEKYFGYPDRALSLLRDMEPIRYQAEADDTAAAAYDGGEEEDKEEDENDWDGNVRKNTQK